MTGENENKDKLDKLVQELLDLIQKRSAKILVQRFGLGKGKNSQPWVLEKIGKELKITRERVRQIELDNFKKLRQAKKNKEFNQLIERAVNFIKKQGGFCEKKFLKESLVKDISSRERNQLMFILNSSSQLQFKKGNLKMEGFWFLANSKIDQRVARAHQYILKYLKEEKKPKKFKTILKELRNSTENSFFVETEGEARLKMLMRVSRVIDRNILYEYGQSNWRSIAQRGSREKAYLVLRKHKSPLHFCEITEHINHYWKDRKALSQTVHNELIKDTRFVLVGRGIYALADWGYPSGTVKEVIASFLEKHRIPVTKQTIIDYVLSKKQVKESTVLVTLTNRDVFYKDNQGNFSIKK